MNETLITPPYKEIKFELIGVMSKAQIKDYVLTFPNATFADSCSVMNNSTGTAIRYGHTPKNNWSLSNVTPSFTFDCTTPKRISIKGIYTDSGKSIFSGGFIFQGSDQTYVPIRILDGSSMSTQSGGVQINTTINGSGGTYVITKTSNTFAFEYTWVNNNNIPNGNYNFQWRYTLTQVQGDGITVTANPTYFDYVIMEF